MSTQGSSLQAEGQRCPLCRLPFNYPKFGEDLVPCFEITRDRMTYWMNKYGGCGSKNVDQITKKYVAPVLAEGKVYATDDSTMDCVRNVCYLQGPHHCQRYKCVEPFCSDALTEDGCNCASKPYSVQQTLKKALETGRKQSFYGWCWKDDNEEWHFMNQEVQHLAIGAKVIHIPPVKDDEDDKSPFMGVVESYDGINGWTIVGETFDGDYKEQGFIYLCMEPLYICCKQDGTPLK
jgi:hypothetical protein